jgi:hypothetical protein
VQVLKFLQPLGHAWPRPSSLVVIPNYILELMLEYSRVPPPIWLKAYADGLKAGEVEALLRSSANAADGATHVPLSGSRITTTDPAGHHVLPDPGPGPESIAPGESLAATPFPAAPALSSRGELIRSGERSPAPATARQAGPQRRGVSTRESSASGPSKPKGRHRKRARGSKGNGGRP